MIRRRDTTVVVLLTALFALSLTTGSFADRNRGWFNWDRGIKGSGDMVTQERDIENFENLDIHGGFDLTITVGEEPSLSITFDDNLIDLVETRVRGKTLIIESEESFSSRHGCEITITSPRLESLSIYGSGDVSITNLKGNLFDCLISGSGDIEVEGNVDEVDISISGSGDVDARHLKAKDAWVKISGSGDVDVFASESFEGTISGSGDINYWGNPPQTRSHVGGSGSIRHR